MTIRITTAGTIFFGRMVATKKMITRKNRSTAGDGASRGKSAVDICFNCFI